MAEVKPFRAFHYGSNLKKSIIKLVCPPYDVISVEQQKKLLKQNKNNFVRVEMPEGQTIKRYSKAAQIWKKWLRSGVINRDSEAAFYVYEAQFRSEMDGRKMVRRGFFGALRLVPWGKGVYPHEKTLPKAKADRLRLFKSVKVQTSPIQCLYGDSNKKSSQIFSKYSKREPWVDYKDSSGVRHRFWKMVNLTDVKTLQSIMKKSPVSIADGHHRYETSRTYSQWARKKWGRKSPASNYIMTYFSPMDDKGLEVLPTHRAVSLKKKKYVNLEKWGHFKRISNLGVLNGFMKGKNGSSPSAVGLFTAGKFYLYTFSKTPASVRRTPKEKLAVARLHAGALDGLGKEDFLFTRSPETAVRYAKKEKGWAFFLAPNTVKEILDVATAKQVVPPKSTFFYPKLPSGIVSYSLYGDQ